MTVQFFGWEVTYDDDSLLMELGTSQQPKDQAVYTMYHGTSMPNAKLIIANGFQQSSRDRVVLELRVRVGRVKKIDRDNHPMQYTWSTQGFDTAWVPPRCGMRAVPSGLEEDCVFDPKRVKVVGIVLAPAAHLTELRQLVAQRSQSEQSQSKQAGYLAAVQAELGGDLQTLSVRHDSLDQQALSAVDLSQPLREGDPDNERR
ncbi:unnamed protein product [Lampetra planeri]